MNLHKHDSSFLPIVNWLRAYHRSWLRIDVIAGLTASAVIIPKAMASAVIAGLPIQAGLYTALAALFVYPLFGSSRLLSVTTTSTIGLMTAAQIAELQQRSIAADPMTVAMTLTFLVGVFLLIARILGLGVVANFISKPVLVGFEAGIGVVIAVSQLKAIFGVHLTHKTTIGILLELPGALRQTHWLTLCIALSGIAILVWFPRWLPRVPAQLVLVGVSGLAVWLFDLGSFGVKLEDAVPTGLPSLTWPAVALINHLWPGALGIALMSFTESVASARTFLRREDPAISPNQELVAIGAANIAAAFFGGLPAGGGASQTAVNARSGALSQVAGFVGGLMVIFCLLFLSSAISLLPQATLGSLVIVVAVSMIKPEKFHKISRIRKGEFGWAIITMIGVITIGTLQGILIAVIISMLNLLYRSNHPPVYAIAHNPDKQIFRPLGENESDVTYPGLLIVRIVGWLTFANASYIADHLRALIEQAQPSVIILECSAISDIEYTALVMLEEAVENMRERGIAVWFAGINPDLHTLIERSSLKTTLGSERIFFDLPKAVETYLARSTGNSEQ
ncbi:sulfate transporter [Candidatus Moduliflexus flocculans]|uniref:Sulfate transporter n=1 Tax=Candidatus Moduliflexus flocculans TaxID=1499966 RepID=A0A0S6VYE2_9BACT|nr:sulfate transporter [Candidatus Moduliflexus flocculans]